jgi:hypothetical protein
MTDTQLFSFGCGRLPRAREGRTASLSIVALARPGLRRIFLHLFFLRQSRKIIPRFDA